MATYSYAQLEGLWIDAGGDPAKAPLMAAIALAESSGNPSARNPSGATGLWQILVPVHGDLIRKYGDPTDPKANAKEAVSIYNSQGLGAWTTYTSGAYKQYLKSGVQPVGLASGGGGGTGTGTNAQDATIGTDQSCCAIGFGGVNIPLAGNQGGFCLLSKTQLNAMFGGFVMAAGLFVAFTGVSWLALYALKRSGVGQALPGPLGQISRGTGAASVVRSRTPSRATGGKAQPLRFDTGSTQSTKPKRYELTFPSKEDKFKPGEPDRIMVHSEAEKNRRVRAANEAGIPVKVRRLES